MTPSEEAIRADERKKERARCVKIVREYAETQTQPVNGLGLTTQAMTIRRENAEFIVHLLSQQEDKP